MTEHDQRPLQERREDAEDIGSNRSDNPTMGDVIAARFNRRDVMKGSLAVATVTATMGPLALAAAKKARAATPSFGFSELEAGVDENHHVAEGYSADVLIRWGDPVVKGAPDFDPMNQTAEAQAGQFGYNNDFIGFIPIDGADDHGFLCVNHEYTNEEIMFPGMGGRQDKAGFSKLTKELADVEMMAHGGSVLEIRKVDGAWQVVGDSDFNRRITAMTEMELAGPAAGHARLQTSADASGTKVLGMLNNCAGGKTPWGTWLAAEENFHGYFWTEQDEDGKVNLPEDHPEFTNYDRYGVPSGQYNWGAYHDRFDITKEPNEPNRFGWIVEIDPSDPTSTPKKRTALGRFKHEGGTTIVNKDGRVTLYSGDDQRFDYIYRFVTSGTYNQDDRAANMDLLDEGTLSVARYNEDGSMDWLPLIHGEGPLTAENGFESQADVVIETRRAADLLGATKMDRPEDVEPNPVTNKVYAMLTNNTRRKPGDENVANPRPESAFGHIIEMTPPDGDHSADQYSWDILVQCGDPSVAEVGAVWNPATSNDGWFGMPDNCAMDSQGRLWISTDGNSASKTGRTDGVWAMETEGEARGTSKHFFRVPVGAELCGPEFAPGDTELFVAIQHPGEKDVEGNGGSFENPGTRWPDFDDNMPVRPSVMVIRKDDGGTIGS
ncbi:MAG: PhoX family protein [Geminicoccaceae bacterium]